MVARWVNEVQQALTSKSPMAQVYCFCQGCDHQSRFGACTSPISEITIAHTQYHALGLLYAIKQRDRLAVSKLVMGQIKQAATSRPPHATCLLIRLASKVTLALNQSSHSIAFPCIYLMPWLSSYDLSCFERTC